MAAMRKKNIIGLDVGSKSTKVAALKFSSGQAHLTHCFEVPSGTSDDSFVSRVKSALSDHKLKGKAAAVCFDDPSMIIRKMELPKMPDADLNEAMKWNLRDHVDADLSEYHVTRSLIQEVPQDSDNVNLQLVVYAIKNEAVENYKAKMNQLGVNTLWIEPEAVTLASTLDRVEKNDDAYIAGVDIGAKHSLFYVVGKRVFLFSRPMRDLNMALYQKSPEDFPQKTAIEIQKSIDTFQVNFQMQRIDKLCLSGGGALIENLATYLETNMGLKTEVLNPFRSVAGVESFPNIQSQLFAKAIGLAYVQL